MFFFSKSKYFSSNVSKKKKQKHPDAFCFFKSLLSACIELEHLIIFKALHFCCCCLSLLAGHQILAESLITSLKLWKPVSTEQEGGKHKACRLLLLNQNRIDRPPYRLMWLHLYISGL